MDRMGRRGFSIIPKFIHVILFILSEDVGTGWVAAPLLLLFRVPDGQHGRRPLGMHVVVGQDGIGVRHHLFAGENQGLAVAAEELKGDEFVGAVPQDLDQVGEVLDGNAIDRLDDKLDRIGAAVGEPVLKKEVTMTRRSPSKFGASSQRVTERGSSARRWRVAFRPEAPAMVELMRS